MRTKKKQALMPDTLKRIQQLGEQIRLARLRRRISITVVAERTGLSRSTIYAVEAGEPGVSIGSYAAVMKAIGMPDEITKPCREDEVGRLLQDSDLHIRRRASQ